MLPKSKIEKILIPYDFSETAALALEHGVFMAKLLRAEIKLVHVLEAMSFTSAISHAFSGFEKKIESASDEKLGEVASKIHNESGVTVSIATEVGRIYKKIAHTAKVWHADLIIMGTHGVSGPQEHVVGTNTVRVIAEAPCPVISVQTHARKVGFTRILVPIDDSANSRQKVPYVLTLAEAYNAHVFILAFTPNTSKEEVISKFKIKVEQTENFVHDYDIITQVVYSDDKNVGEATLKFANQNDIDLILIMTEQEFSITGTSLGAFANHIINHSKTPVLSCGPREVNANTMSVGY
jgi:nucleotide-binding universal stress UspA family protein